MDERKRQVLHLILSGFLLPDLKKIISRLNERLVMRLSKTQRKGVLINMVVNEVAMHVANGDIRILDILVEIMNELKMSKTFERVDSYIGLVRSRPDATSYSGTTTTGGMAPRLSAASSSFQYSVEYKTSPFYTIHSGLAPPKICTSSVNTRASRMFAFEMTPEQERYFEERHPEDGRSLYEIRFFCTGYDTQTSSRAKDIEFPAICEIKVNSDHTINGSAMRGLKNKPGTANPADLTSSCHISSRRNTVEFVYAHTAKPYIGSVELVKRFSVAEIVKNLKATSIISKQETLRRLQERKADTDIVLESETISTKCPLGFTRIKTPSRSKHCQHLQCFDATTFLLMNQQTPTWSCPICNRKMESWEEVGVDEYFQDILAKVSQRVDTIRIEDGGIFKVLDSDDMDGDTDDDDEHVETGDNTKINKRPLDSRENSIIGADHGSEKWIDSVTILDDDGDDDLDDSRLDDIPLSKRHKTATASQSSEPSASMDSSQVIDLTLDSDDETTDDSSINGINTINSDIGASDKGNSDISNAPSALPKSTASTDQNGTDSTRQPTTITTSPSAPNDSASPATTKTANSTLSPKTPPQRNLIRLPWPPVPRQQSPHIPASSSMPENSATYHLPAVNYSQQPPPPASSTNIYIVPPNPSSQTPSSQAQPPSTLVNSTPMNSFLHK